MTSLLLRLARAVLLPVIVEAMREHDQEVTSRINYEMGRRMADPTKPGR
jgi:hypothetical protein